MMTMVKTGARRVLFGAVFPVVALVFMLGLIPESRALLWHLKNGNAFKLGGYEIPVPPLTVVTADRDGRSVTLSHTPGALRTFLFRDTHRAQITFATYQLSWTPLEKELLTNRFMEGGKLSFGMKVVAGEEKSFFRFFPDEVRVDEVCRTTEGKQQGLESRFLGDKTLLSEYDSVLLRIRKSRD